MMRRIMLLGFSVLLAVVAVASLRMTPSATCDRLCAIPSYAKLVYHSESPDWSMPFFPMDETNAAAFFTGWARDLKELEHHPLTVATVPFAGRAQRDTWIAVSELGSPVAQVLRWRLMLFSPEGISLTRPYATWPVWSFEHPTVPAWAQVRFTITESLLICSISADSHDIYKLLDVADGRAASFTY